MLTDEGGKTEVWLGEAPSNYLYLMLPIQQHIQENDEKVKMDLDI